ncbi:MAG: hypothetical protein EOO92_19340, partial [Pedobacter sp.]
ITAPNPRGQRLALQRAYAAAGVPIASIGLFEAHGTSTPVGDTVELKVLSDLLAESTSPKQVPIAKDLLDEAYDNLKTVSVNDNQLLSRGYLSLDHFLGSGAGYAFYDFYGAMFPGDKERAHIVYNLPRPILIKTAKGNYAKLIIYSFYKDSPLSPTLQSQAPYITFKYIILKDGSKDFTKISK